MHLTFLTCQFIRVSNPFELPRETGLKRLFNLNKAQMLTHNSDYPPDWAAKVNWKRLRNVWSGQNKFKKTFCRWDKNLRHENGNFQGKSDYLIPSKDLSSTIRCRYVIEVGAIPEWLIQCSGSHPLDKTQLELTSIRHGAWLSGDRGHWHYSPMEMTKWLTPTPLHCAGSFAKTKPVKLFSLHKDHWRVLRGRSNLAL